jgi:hypothetical protein
VDATYPNRDQHAARRRELRELLGAVVDRAVERDGIELYLSRQAVLGVPIPASLLVTAVPEDPELPGEFPAQVLVDGLRSKHGERAEVTEKELPCGPAVRCRRQEASEDAAELGQPQDRPTSVLDVYLPVPGSGAWLLLTFSTPVVELADAQMDLFDAVAGSLRWSYS